MQRLHKLRCLKPLKILNRALSSVSSSEYSSTPQYPTIYSTDPKEVLKRQKNEKYAKYDRLNTVEEKLFAINLDKYYGWNCVILKEHCYPYQFLSFVRFITRTLSIQDNRELFHKVQNVDINECKLAAENVKKYLQEAILFMLKDKKRLQEDSRDDVSKEVIETINSVLLTFLSTQYSHLLDTVVDYDPRLEAFWMVGSFQPSDADYQKNKKDLKKDEKEKDLDLVDHWIQYFGAPVIQLRHKHLLPQLETQHLKVYNDAENIPSIPVDNFDPSLSYGLEFKRRHGTNIPGYWPGEENEFGILSYHNQGYLLDRPPHFGSKDHDDTVLAQSILASYAWLHGQASYQGFSTFTELTYPLITQNIITDGRQFSFSLYQLNTTILHSEHSLQNQRMNISLSMPTMSLYQEIQGNEFVGWNDDVVSTLVSFYLNQPKQREGLNLKPYLNSEERYLSDIDHNERRIWLHNQFRHMYCNRKRERLGYEIYDWERIYKVTFQTRPIEARRRPFEVDENPLEERKYYEHMPPYIPKQFRPKKKHWTGWRAKFAKTYYPDV